MTVLDATFDQGLAAFSFEGHSESGQITLEPSTRRLGGKQVRFTIGPNDTFGGAPGTRALFTKSNARQGEGEAWWLTQFQIPTEDCLVFELHQDHPELDSQPGVIAPYAANYRSGDLCGRTCVGDFAAGSNPNSTIFWDPNHVLVSKPAKGQWIDLVLHALFTEKPGGGFVEWFVDPTGKGRIDPSKPAFPRIKGIQTIPTYRAGGVTGHSIYLEQGGYRGWPMTTTMSGVHGGTVRADSFAELAPWLGGSVNPDPPDPPVFTAVDNHDGTVYMKWIAVPGAEEYVPTIDGREYLTDGRRHPIGPGQLATHVAKPPDGKPHAYGIRANDRVASWEATV